MESPFSQHFSTNYLPTDTEIELIRAHLTPHEASLQRLEGLIRTLTAQRDRVKDYIAPYKALISHPRRLPYDLVEQIFLACLPTDYYPDMRSTDAPLLLCHICSSWRIIALSLPRLWASLHITDPDGTPGKWLAVNTWLQRSSTVPLALSLSSILDDGDDHMCGFADHRVNHRVVDDAVLDSLRQVAHRWQHLQICPTTTSDFIKSLAWVNAPLLVDVAVTLLNDEPSIDTTQILSSKLFRGPHVRRVAISTAQYDGLVPYTRFSWPHLVNLTLGEEGSGGGLSTQAAYRLLKGCPQLVSLQIRLDRRWGGPLLLQFLESFGVFDHCLVDRQTVGDFVDHLIMPRLRHIQLPCDSAGATWTISNLQSLALLAERSPAISSFGFPLMNFSKDALAEALRFFPSLARITVSHSPHHYPATALTNDLFDLLSPDPDIPSQKLCPELNELVLRNYWVNPVGMRASNGGFCDDVWVAFLQKQVDCRTSLRRFEIHFGVPRPSKLEDLPDVRLFAARGLDVYFRYPPVARPPLPRRGAYEYDSDDMNY
ncbi:hypothetical protein FB451DRAFT_1274251 [Mycena latifolia]|nr:hypothetical protein FB451DRAFT_1274251 [Mycena latifolia]